MYDDEDNDGKFQLAGQVDELTDELAGDDRPGEGYLGKAGRLTAARQQAEEIIRHEHGPLISDLRHAHPGAGMLTTAAPFGTAGTPAAITDGGGGPPCGARVSSLPLWATSERPPGAAEEAETVALPACKS